MSRFTFLQILVFTLCAATLVWAAREFQLARAQATLAVGQLNKVAGQARELMALRADAPRDHKPASGLASRVTAALTRSGLSASTLSSLSPESVVQSGASVKRQRATLTLGGATLPQVGAFLEAWRSSEPAWTVTSVDLSVATAPNAVAGGDLPLRSVIVLEAVYFEPDGGDR